MDYQTIRLRVDGRIARISLARPDRGNRVDLRMLSELADAASQIAASDGVSLAVLDADGSDFCLGWESEAKAGLLTDAGAPGTVDPFGCIAALPCPVLAVINGPAISAGLELALAADVRVCGDQARFALPEVSDGLLPLAGGSQRLPRAVGRSRAAAMVLLGEELSAEAALQAGLVSRVFADAELASGAGALAARMAAQGPLALRYAKEAVHNGLEMTLEHGLRYELDLSIILQTTADRAEGVKAFLEKRPPHFQSQ